MHSPHQNGCTRHARRWGRMHSDALPQSEWMHSPCTAIGMDALPPSEWMHSPRTAIGMDALPPSEWMCSPCTAIGMDAFLQQNGCARHARQVQRPASPLLRGGECQAERRGLVQRVPFPDPTAFGKGGRPLEGVKWRVSFFWHVEHVVPASMCAHKFFYDGKACQKQSRGPLERIA